MSRLVMKFGGTSMTFLERIRPAAELVASEVQAGKSAVFTVKVNNSGNGAANGVKVCLKSPGPKVVEAKRCGFLGKVMLLEAAAGHPWQAGVWAVVLGVGLLTLIGLARAGSILFWHVNEQALSVPAGSSPRLVMATTALLAATVGMTVWAAPIQRYTEATARQLQDREGYARAVLGPAGAQQPTMRPYRFDTPISPGTSGTAGTPGGSR